MRVPSLTDITRGFLEEAIFTGKFKPGSQVKEEQVSAELGISRPPIRETFKMLEAEGLIIRKARRGVFVAEIRKKDAWEIYTLKADLYSLSITLSFDRLTGADLSRMGSVVAAMEECVQSDSPSISSYQELNTSFHDLHVDAAGHHRLKQILQTLHNQVRYFSYQTLRNPKHLRTSCEYHRKIYEAFKMGNLEATQQLTQEHIRSGLKRLDNTFEVEGRSYKPGTVTRNRTLRG